MRVLFFVALLLLAGCSEPVPHDQVVLRAEAEFAGSVHRQGSASCDSQVGLDVDLRDADLGEVRVKVTDGVMAYDETVPAGDHVRHDLVGTPGEWQIDATAANLRGGFLASLSC